MNGLNFLLQTNLYLLLFMGFYVVVLRNETFFRQNRFFLNTSIFLSFLIPFINSDWFRDLFITQRVREAAIMPSQIMYETIIVGINDEASTLTLSDAIFMTYCAGATFLLLRFFIRLAFLGSNLKAGKGTAFSFFKTMVVDTDMPKANTIIDHEKVHMRQWHSADIIFIELASIINWFNPVMYLFKKEIRHIHEFIADEEAATLMQSKADYALLLFSNTLGVDPLHLSNNFFNKSLLKRRILMLHKTRSNRTGLWKYGFSAPLFIVMLILSAATVKSEQAFVRPVAENILSPLGAETSSEIIEALDLDEPPQHTSKAISEEPKTTSAQTTEVTEVAPDFSALKQHMMRTLKYPMQARQNNITGIAVATFTVAKNEIVGANIVRGLQTNINGDLLTTLTSFRSELTVPDGTYTVAIKYRFTDGAEMDDFVPGTRFKNYIGQVVVTGYKSAATDSKSSTGSSQAPRNIEGQPYNGSVANAINKEIQVAKTTNGGEVKSGEIKDFASVDVLPEFRGGMAGWGKYLQSNLKYPKSARDNNVTGRVILSFVVEKDGTLSEIKVLRGLGSGLDEEAMRVLQNSPPWIPGVDNDRPVRVAYTMPIFFQLAVDNSPKTDGVKP